MNREFWSAPNQLTLLRLFFAPFIAICVLDRHFLAGLILIVIAGASDWLDGVLARRLHQQTRLGEYLDPIVDKLLLSTLFIVLSFRTIIPWRYTVVVLSRDLCILVVAAVLYQVGLRDFRPGALGKISTLCQIAAVIFVLLEKVYPTPATWATRQILLYAVFTFAVASAIHYVYLTGQRLRHLPHAS
jgi:cardiolipin synthase